MEEVRRYTFPVGLVMLDLDDFTAVNDLHGHQQGDVVLRVAAEILRDTKRDVDVAARYGGEEFALIVPHTDLDRTYTIAERIRDAIGVAEIPLLKSGGTIRSTATVGVAASSDGDKNELIAAADAALYTAKRQGKNRTVRAGADTAETFPAPLAEIPPTPDGDLTEGARTSTLCRMGLLDEAIREHLDLQRRRGADPTEVERAEREALGPVRRAPQSAPGADDEAHDSDGFEPEAPDAELDALDAGHESERAGHEPARYEPESYEPATQVAPPPEPEPAFDQEADSWSYEDSQREPGAAAPPPAGAQPPLAEPPEEPPSHSAPPATGGETEEYDVEAALTSESEREGKQAGGDEDVLEETPEFLQDTPDHDRLWFEQRPPKDFDFEG